MNVAYNMDCMEYMRTLQDKAFDLAVVDPPYFSGPERRGYYGCKISPIGVKRDYPVSPKWDIPDAEFFAELDRVSKHYIVWGCNYFDFVFSHGRIVWDKCKKGTSFSLSLVALAQKKCTFKACLLRFLKKFKSRCTARLRALKTLK